MAKVLSSREVAINLGAHDGVQVGMAFDVMNPKGDDIKDPDTNELLGSVVLPKIRVWVSQVHDKVSVATTTSPGSGLHLEIWPESGVGRVSGYTWSHQA